MTTFYRTPDVVVDAHEWHVVVWRKSNRKVTVAYRWRPVATRTHKWLSIASWQGPMPKGLWKFFAKYRAHIEIARKCDTNRRQAIARLNLQRPSGAMVRNVGTERAAA